MYAVSVLVIGTRTNTLGLPPHQLSCLTTVKSICRNPMVNLQVFYLYLKHERSCHCLALLATKGSSAILFQIKHYLPGYHDPNLVHFGYVDCFSAFTALKFVTLIFYMKMPAFDKEIQLQFLKDISLYRL